MHKAILIFFLFLTTNLAAAQVLEPALINLDVINGNNSDQPLHCKSTSDGGYIFSWQTSSTTGMASSTCNPNSSWKTVFQKFDSSGSSIQWQKCFSASNDSMYEYMFLGGNGEYILGGTKGTITGSSGRAWIVRKEDANGNILWSKIYGGSNSEFLRDMVATDDGGFIMCGETYSQDGDVGFHYGNFMLPDIWVIKIDSSGKIVWSKVIGGTDEDHAISIIKTPGGFYIVGSSASGDFDCTGVHYPGQFTDAYIVKLDVNGTIEWHQCYGGNKGALAESATSDGNGGLYICSEVSEGGGNIKNYIGDADYWILHTDSYGAILWENCFGSSNSYEVPFSICKGNDGTIWVAGISNKVGGQVAKSYGGGDTWVVYINASGNLVKAKVLGTSGSEKPYLIYPLSAGIVFVAGTFDKSGDASDEFPLLYLGGGDDIYTAKFAPWTTDISLRQHHSLLIEVYPNPAMTDFTICNQTEQSVEINITDFLGHIIFHDKCTNGKPLRLYADTWPKGVYMINEFFAEGETAHKKLIIQ